MLDDAELDAIRTRIANCRTYNFGMRDANLLAHEDAAALLRDLRVARQQLALPVQDADLREKVRAILDRGPHVEDWPEDERTLYRTHRGDFTSRAAALLDLRVEKIIAAVLHPAQDEVDDSGMPKWERHVEAPPVEVTEAMAEAVARIIANAACDWIDRCDDDDHPLGHSNWEAYMDDARTALRALRILPLHPRTRRRAER